MGLKVYGKEKLVSWSLPGSSAIIVVLSGFKVNTNIKNNFGKWVVNGCRWKMYVWAYKSLAFLVYSSLRAISTQSTQLYAW